MLTTLYALKLNYRKGDEIDKKKVKNRQCTLLVKRGKVSFEYKIILLIE